MKKHLGLLSLLTPALCVGVLSASTARFDLTHHALRGAGQARPTSLGELTDARYGTPSACTPAAAAVVTAAAADYAVEETYVADVVAWAQEQFGE